MGKNGKRLSLNDGTPKYGGGSKLVSSEQDRNIRKRKISFSFFYFKQIDDFGIGNCSQTWHIGLLNVSLW